MPDSIPPLKKMSFPFARIRRRLSWFVLFALSSPCSSQTEKTPIYIDCACDDQVGQLYATALRDAVATSPRFTEASVKEVKSPDGKTSVYNLVLAIVTLDVETPPGGHSTAISAVLLMGNNFLFAQWVQACGRNVVQSCAEATLANLDRHLHSK
jgi:hypothetical protein